MEDEFEITREIQDLQVFSSISAVRDAIELQADRLENRTSHMQYIGFLKVTRDTMNAIENEQEKRNIPRYARLHYDEIKEILIIKLMSLGVLEVSHTYLSDMMKETIWAMGIRSGTLLPVGATRYKAAHSSKEGDSSFQPRSRDPKTDWPSLVFEAGLSESLPRLQLDARWWLESANSQVKIVVLIAVNEAIPRITVQKWEMVQGARRAQQIQGLFITPNSVQGAPLILHFEKVFLRQPIPPETDIVFTTPMLMKYATILWSWRFC